MIKIVILVIIAEIWTAVGQVLFKKSTNSLDVHNFKTPAAQFKFLKSVIAKPGIWIGFFTMAVGMVFWLIALADGELSIVYPIGSLQYVIILFSAHFLLGEKIDRMKALGTFLVVLGIIFITMS